MRGNNVDTRDTTDTQQQFLSIDFVTALTVDECVARLHGCGDSQGEVTVNEDGSFSLRCLVGKDRAEVRFWGTMEPHERGTWVWGTIFEERPEGWQLQPWIPAFLVAGLLFLAFQALSRAAFTQMAIWIGILLALVVVAIWRWYRRYRHGLRIVAWVYEILYVPPPPPKPNDTPHTTP